MWLHRKGSDEVRFQVKTKDGGIGWHLYPSSPSLSLPFYSSLHCGTQRCMTINEEHLPSAVHSLLPGFHSAILMHLATNMRELWVNPWPVGNTIQWILDLPLLIIRQTILKCMVHESSETSSRIEPQLLTIGSACNPLFGSAFPAFLFHIFWFPTLILWDHLSK